MFIFYGRGEMEKNRLGQKEGGVKGSALHPLFQ